MNFWKGVNQTKLMSWVTAAVGLLLLLNSPPLASEAASSWTRSVSTDEYVPILKGYIDCYKLIGAIFLFIGLFSCFQQPREK